MSQPVIVIRPEPGLSETAARAAIQGLDVMACSLFEIEPLEWEVPDPAAIDGLLLGSANAVRHGGAGLEALRGKPVYAVGRATAQAAREAGFVVTRVGEGAMQQLLETSGGRRLTLLRLAGEQHVELRLPANIEMVTRVAYASVARPMPPELAETLTGGAVVLLHSAAAAGHFAAECDRLGLDRRRISLAAFAPRVATAAGTGWRALAVSPQPSDAALLALAGDICHGGAASSERG